MHNEDIAGVCVDIAISQGPRERKSISFVANTDQILLTWIEDDAEFGCEFVDEGGLHVRIWSQVEDLVVLGMPVSI